MCSATAFLSCDPSLLAHVNYHLCRSFIVVVGGFAAFSREFLTSLCSKVANRTHPFLMASMLALTCRVIIVAFSLSFASARKPPIAKHKCCAVTHSALQAVHTRNFVGRAKEGMEEQEADHEDIGMPSLVESRVNASFEAWKDKFHVSDLEAEPEPEPQMPAPKPEAEPEPELEPQTPASEPEAEPEPEPESPAPALEPEAVPSY